MAESSEPNLVLDTDNAVRESNNGGNLSESSNFPVATEVTNESVKQSHAEERYMPKKKPKSTKRSELNSCKVDLMNCGLATDPELKQHLPLFEFFIPIQVSVDTNRDHMLLCLDLVPSKGVEFLTMKTDMLYIYCGADARNTVLLYWEEMDDSNFEKPKAKACLASTSMPQRVFQALSDKKHFTLVWSFCSLANFDGIIRVQCHVNSCMIQHLSHPSDIIMHGRVKTDVKYLLSYIRGLPYIEYEDKAVSDKKLVNLIYENIQNCYQEDAEVTVTGHPLLIPNLRPYQSQNVQWMLQKESPSYAVHDSTLCHPLYERLVLNNETFYFHKFSGYFVDAYFSSLPICRGGVLADEMGLGKTVEVLTLILMHPRENVPLNQNKGYLAKEIKSNSDDQNISCSAPVHVSSKANNAKRKNMESQSASISKRRICLDSNSENLNTSSTPVTGKKYFQCVCGSINTNSTELLECTRCGLLQHASCVLNDPTCSCSPYLCPHCWIILEPTVSRATLIICPQAIIYQWEEEIEKHIKKDSLKVFMYQGIQSQKFIQPPVLADNDIVLISYETLKKEIYHVNIENNESRRNMRNPKKFSALPSPLTSVHWWRICLDEAQMVEKVTTMTSAMTRELLAENRWCVTGTPIQKSIKDLYGLMLFLGYDPYSQKMWWKELVLKPAANEDFSTLLNVVNQVMWRTQKKNVLDQIGIPPQGNVCYQLNFSIVESAFYDQQHQQCAQDFTEIVEEYRCLNAKLSDLNQDFVKKLMDPFRKLRLACCHPQLITSAYATIKNSITMPELLEIMIKKNKLVCEELHRQYIASLNGLAGIHLIRNDYDDAISAYVQVLHTVKKRSEILRTDKIQQIHTLFNLAETLNCIMNSEKTSSEKIPIEKGNRLYTNEKYINMLKSEASTLHDDYLKKHLMLVETARNNFESAFKQAEKLLSCSKRNELDPWWIKAASSESSDEDKHIIDRVKSKLEYFQIGHITIQHRFYNTTGLKYVVEVLLKALKNQHDVILKKICDLPNTPSPNDVQSASKCHLRRDKEHMDYLNCFYDEDEIFCTYCKVDKDLKDFEHTLYQFYCVNDSSDSDEEIYEEQMNEDGIYVYDKKRKQNDGRKDSELEIVLKCLLKIAKQKRGLATVVEDGVNHLKWFEALKKEFKCMRRLWIDVTNYVAAVDETEMAKIRMRLPLPGEDIEHLTLYCPNVVLDHKVDLTLVKFKLQAADFESRFQSKHGRMLFLETLKSNEMEESPPSSTKDCPVCQYPMSYMWAVLSCGHSICESCLNIMIMKLSYRNAINCPVCRDYTLKRDINHVHSATDFIQVKGSWSTKITGIINCLGRISKNDSTAKSLIFSTHASFFNLLEMAFELNEIFYVRLDKKKDLKNDLSLFKNDPDINVLMLPYHIGSNGLNIIEASHVLLAEPILDHSIVQQAIGRIHRIGQTKATTVHQFFVQNTIEEKIYYLKKPSLFAEENDAENALTVSDIVKLFENKG